MLEIERYIMVFFFPPDMTVYVENAKKSAKDKNTYQNQSMILTKLQDTRSICKSQLYVCILLLLLLLSRFSLSDSVRPQRQPTRLPHPWDSPGKNTGVGCHFLPQCMLLAANNQKMKFSNTVNNSFKTHKTYYIKRMTR